MARIIKQASEALLVEDSVFTGDAIRQTVELSINNYGKVSTTGVINLGNQGDDGVTILHFNVSNALSKLIENGNYQSMIIDTNQSGYERTYNFNGIDFYVPSGITLSSGEHSLVYVVMEKESSTEGGNTNTNSEVFASSSFIGSVNPTNAPLITDPKELPSVEDTNVFTKPAIKMSYKGSVNDSEIGYAFDKYIRYIELVEKHSSLQQYVIYYTGYVPEEDGSFNLHTFGYYVNENYKSWVPPVVTQNPGTWQIMIVGYNNEGAEYYSNVFIVNVIDNNLSDVSLNAVLLDSDLMPLADEDGLPILVTRPEVGANYRLAYKGAKVDALLKKTDELANVAVSGNYYDLLNVPVLETGCYTLGTVNPNSFTINTLISKIAEKFDELKDSQRVRIYLFDDTDLMNQVRDTREFLITKKRTTTNDGITTYDCTLYYDDYTIYKINLWLEEGIYRYSYTEEETQLKKDIDSKAAKEYVDNSIQTTKEYVDNAIQTAITGALAGDY